MFKFVVVSIYCELLYDVCVTISVDCTIVAVVIDVDIRCVNQHIG